MRRNLPLIAVLLWAAAIFTVSSFPNPPGTSGGEWKSQLAHTTEYAILAALIFHALRSARPTTPVVALAGFAWALATLYGMSDEFHQSFVPNRDANWLDVGFDALGSAIGVTLALAFERTGRRRKTQN